MVQLASIVFRWLSGFAMTTQRQETPCDSSPSNLFSFDEWLRGRNLTRTTGYRYRKQGIISTVNIFGRLYITREEIANFERRAVAGEFNKAAKTPSRHGQPLA